MMFHGSTARMGSFLLNQTNFLLRFSQGPYSFSMSVWTENTYYNTRLDLLSPETKLEGGAV